MISSFNPFCLSVCHSEMGECKTAPENRLCGGKNAEINDFESSIHFLVIEWAFRLSTNLCISFCERLICFLDYVGFLIRLFAPLAIFSRFGNRLSASFGCFSTTRISHQLTAFEGVARIKS